MTQHTKQGGFTLVELMLAMAFVSFILLFIVFAMLQVMGNYNKGIAIKNINQTSRTIVEEMARLVRSTSAEAINTSKVTSNGRVCFGNISYVWNVKSGTTNKFTDNTPVTMVRVEDPSGTLCGASLPAVDSTKATTLISGNVWVQAVQVTVSGNQKLVDFTLRLSTANENQPTGTDSVWGPSSVCEGGSNGNYCAVAQFSTTVSTRNGGQ